MSWPIPAVYFQKAGFPLSTVMPTTGISIAGSPETLESQELVEMCRPSHLKPALYKVLPGLVITGMVFLWAMCTFWFGFREGAMRQESKGRDCLLLSILNLGPNRKQRACPLHSETLALSPPPVQTKQNRGRKPGLFEKPTSG